MEKPYETRGKVSHDIFLAACAVAGIAVATQSTGVLSNIISVIGTINHDVHAHAHVALPGSDDGFSAELETEGPANFIVQDVVFAPLGTTGWHKHPGVLLLSLTADSRLNRLVRCQLRKTCL